MVGKYRSKIDITIDILRNCVEETRLTRVMYETHTSWSQLKEYMKYLEENKLIMVYHDRIPRVCCITKKGIQLLKDYEALDNAIPLMLKT